ncbi:uncharacterized protein K489DRAFT_89687 [Dissoconium aciculare CBS 342.82]|uniref:Uncharacterized protein n=1 Tax=Dissoconium aciculare CBS 342.82 TaxID=1314786 RepID=A0A6J3LSZ5_9PEZI|nr:uncharacterized protein K489DRAFT_89687 [Dissoconium aciculare CBS 342.82]KAF1818758.1 hypothetical protein K489DRAFT_89687 [Dissoconium aciculare CBS 342.82]
MYISRSDLLETWPAIMIRFIWRLTISLGQLLRHSREWPSWNCAISPARVLNNSRKRSLWSRLRRLVTRVSLVELACFRLSPEMRLCDSLQAIFCDFVCTSEASDFILMNSATGVLANARTASCRSSARSAETMNCHANIHQSIYGCLYS